MEYDAFVSDLQNALSGSEDLSFQQTLDKLAKVNESHQRRVKRAKSWSPRTEDDLRRKLYLVHVLNISKKFSPFSPISVAAMMADAGPWKLSRPNSSTPNSPTRSSNAISGTLFSFLP